MCLMRFLRQKLQLIYLIQKANMLPKTSGVYIITNKINNKVYVGSSIHMERRQKEHIKNLNRGKHAPLAMINDWHKYGPEKFQWAVLKEVTDLTLLVKEEQHWLNHYIAFSPDKGYNRAIIASNTIHGPKSAKAKRLEKEALKAEAARLKTEMKEAYELNYQFDVAKQKETLPGFFAICNLKLKFVYIDWSIDGIRGMEEHITLLNLGLHPLKILQSNWIKYGKEAFRWDMIFSEKIESYYKYSISTEEDIKECLIRQRSNIYLKYYAIERKNKTLFNFIYDFCSDCARHYPMVWISKNYDFIKCHLIDMPILLYSLPNNYKGIQGYSLGRGFTLLRS